MEACLWPPVSTCGLQLIFSPVSPPPLDLSLQPPLPLARSCAGQTPGTQPPLPSSITVSKNKRNHQTAVLGSCRTSRQGTDSETSSYSAATPNVSSQQIVAAPLRSLNIRESLPWHAFMPCPQPFRKTDDAVVSCSVSGLVRFLQGKRSQLNTLCFIADSTVTFESSLLPQFCQLYWRNLNTFMSLSSLQTSLRI